MDSLRKLGSVVYQMFKKPDKTYRFEDVLFYQDSFEEFLAERTQEAEMIVVGMMFMIEGPDGQDITPADIAKVLEYRDHEYFASLPRYMVQDFFFMLWWLKVWPNNPYKKVSYSLTAFLSPQCRPMDPLASFSSQCLFLFKQQKLN